VVRDHWILWKNVGISFTLYWSAVCMCRHLAVATTKIIVNQYLSTLVLFTLVNLVSDMNSLIVTDANFYHVS